MTAMLTLSNLLAWSAQIAVLVTAVFLAIRLLRLEVPAVRHAMLRTALAACLLLPLLQALQPPRTGQAGTAASFELAPGPVGTAQGDAGSARGLIPFTKTPWTTALGLLLGAGVVVRLAWMSAGIIRLRGLRRAGEIAVVSAGQDELQATIGTRATIRYVRRLGQPVTFGFRTPVVLLPQSLQGQHPAIQRAVLAHELWHVRRRDWIWTVAEETVRALFWFHPAMWILLSRIQSTREEVVDELSILATGSRRSYLDALLAYADASPLFAATAFARRRHLVHRMVLISKEAVMSARRVVASCAVLAFVGVSAGWYAVQAFPLVQAPVASDVLSETPGPVEQRARSITPENPIPRRTSHVEPRYPSEAAAVGARGTITVRVVIDESGQVAETRARAVMLRTDSGASVSFNVGSAGSLERALRADLRDAAGQSVPVGPFVQAIVEAAAEAVSGWRYAPPAEGPLAFSVVVPIGGSRGGPAAIRRTTPEGVASARAPVPSDRPGIESARQVEPDGALRVGGNIKPPQKTWHVNPVYPQDAQDAGVAGVIIIEARVEADGTVGDTRVLKSIPMLDDAAVEAVRQWEFEPTLLNGEPVPVIMTVTVNFTLQ